MKCSRYCVEVEELRSDDPVTIGPYTLVARLGAGGMGVVFLAQNGANSVALKVVRSSYLDNKNLHSRFIREIETLKRIDSPYAAKILDYAVDRDTAWHAVEYVSGPTLKEKIETEGPLDAGAWDELAAQLHQALEDVHRLGIVHRDIKPANLVMGETGVKLIDFGIAQDDDATSMTVTGLVAGSPAWLSPERLEGHEDTPASDFFSAGSVLFFAATGRNPWLGSENTKVSAAIAKIIAGAPDLTGLTPTQETIVRGLLHSDPKKRSWKLPISQPEPAVSVPSIADSGSQPVVSDSEDRTGKPRWLVPAIFSVAAFALIGAVGAISYLLWGSAASQNDSLTTVIEPATPSQTTFVKVPFVKVLDVAIEATDEQRAAVGLVRRDQNQLLLMQEIRSPLGYLTRIVDSQTLSPISSFTSGYGWVVSPTGDLLSTSGMNFIEGEELFSFDSLTSCVLFQIDTGQVIDVFPDAGRLCASTFSPDGTLYYFLQVPSAESADQSGESGDLETVIRVIDVVSGLEQDSIPLGANAVDVSALSYGDILAYGDFLIVSSHESSWEGDSFVTLLDRYSGSVLGEITIGGPGDGHLTATDFVVSEDGKLLYFIMGRVRESAQVWAVDLETLSTFYIYDSDFDQTGDYAISPDGRFLAIRGYNLERATQSVSREDFVTIIDTATKVVAQKISSPKASGIIFSDDGRLHIADSTSLASYEYSESYELQ